MPYPPQPFAFGYYFAFEASKRGEGGGGKGKGSWSCFAQTNFEEFMYHIEKRKTSISPLEYKISGKFWGFHKIKVKNSWVTYISRGKSHLMLAYFLVNKDDLLWQISLSTLITCFLTDVFILSGKITIKLLPEI